MSFKQQLIKMEACPEAIKWVEERTLEQTWNDCHRGDWMLWLLGKMKKKEEWPDEKEIMLMGCWCARRALKYISEEEIRPLKAIEAKEAWVRGEITKEEMAAALAVVMVVGFAARASANSVAWGAASDAAWAATCDVTRAVSYAARYVAWDKESSIQADYIRTQFTPAV